MTRSGSGDCHRNCRVLLRVCSTALMLAAGSAARADDSLIEARGQVSLGSFLNNSELKIRVDGESSEGGAHGMWRIGGNFYLDAQAQFFVLSFDKYDGNIVNYRAAFTWQPKRSVGIGLGYDHFTIDVDVDEANFMGSMDWTYSGPQAFFNLSF